MNFNTHSRLDGQHAFLSPSKYHWVNYDEEKLDLAFTRYRAAQRGIDLHALAHECIRLGVKLPKTRNTLNLYVNDAIGFRMTTEQPLWYSDNCFGHADTISFRNNFLRIHDYKSGITRASMTQLLVYAALFCLEYNVSPFAIDMEFRLYQSDDVLVLNQEIDPQLPQKVHEIMEKIIFSDKRLDQLLSIGG